MARPTAWGNLISRPHPEPVKGAPVESQKGMGMAFLTFLVNKHPTPPAPISVGQPFPKVSHELPCASNDGITTLLDTLPFMDFSHQAP